MSKLQELPFPMLFWGARRKHSKQSGNVINNKAALPLKSPPYNTADMHLIFTQYLCENNT